MGKNVGAVDAATGEQFPGLFPSWQPNHRLDQPLHRFTTTQKVFQVEDKKHTIMEGRIVLDQRLTIPHELTGHWLPWQTHGLQFVSELNFFGTESGGSVHDDFLMMPFFLVAFLAAFFFAVFFLAAFFFVVFFFAFFFFFFDGPFAARSANKSSAAS